MFEALSIISIYSTMILGIGVIMVLLLRIWKSFFRLILEEVGIQKQFIDFMWQKFEKKRFKE